MQKAGIKFRDLILVIGIVVALFAGILSAYIFYQSEPVTEPSPQESNITPETQGSMVKGVLSLVFKNGLDLVQIMRSSQ